MKGQNIIHCKKCLMPNTRPDSIFNKDNVCQACINNEKKNEIDFLKRQEWLTNYIKKNKKKSFYDCLVAVSGGKDSHMIVKRLIENHNIKNPLLVTVTDEFTHSRAGQYNINNLVTRYNLDHIVFRCKPKDFIENTRKDFEREFHPLKWIEEKIYRIPLEIAEKYNINLIFFGENSAFEYGTSKSLEIFHPETNRKNKIIFMGAIYPYSISDSLKEARSIGFKNLDDFNEWKREGSIEQDTQIDSFGYIVQLWTKYPKFGFQRVSDIASRYVREGKITLKEAKELIIKNDHKLDKIAMEDFIRCLGYTKKDFWDIADKFWNPNLFIKKNKKWKRNFNYN